jgi:hypothetical protein
VRIPCTAKSSAPGQAQRSYSNIGAGGPAGRRLFGNEAPRDPIGEPLAVALAEMNTNRNCRPPIACAATEPPPRRETALPPHWAVLERGFTRFYGIRPANPDGTGLLAYSVYRHRGAPAKLRRGAVVRSGDLLVEIHLRREGVLEILAEPDPLRRGVTLLKAARAGMRCLAQRLAHEPDLAEVCGTHALTLYHIILAQCGFEVHPLTNRWAERWYTTWQRRLFQRDAGAAGALLPADTVVRHAWLSREELFQVFTPRVPPPPAPEPDGLPHRHPGRPAAPDAAHPECPAAGCTRKRR